MVQEAGQSPPSNPQLINLLTDDDRPPNRLSVSVCVQQGQGGASSTIQSESEPRQVRSRWAEQMNPLTFCSNFSPSPNKSQGEEEDDDEEEEEEEDFHPQSLECLLEEEEEEEVRNRLLDQ